jgi:hypothetical protein
MCSYAKSVNSKPMFFRLRQELKHIRTYITCTYKAKQAGSLLWNPVYTYMYKTKRADILLTILLMDRRCLKVVRVLVSQELFSYVKRWHVCDYTYTCTYKRTQAGRVLPIQYIYIYIYIYAYNAEQAGSVQATAGDDTCS